MINLTVKIISLAVLFLATTTVAGWLLKELSLIQIYPSFDPMQFNTALCFMMLSLSLIIPARKATNEIKTYKILPCILCLMVSSITLFQYPFNINTGLDTLFNYPFIESNTSHTARMGPNAALCFMFSSVALLLTYTAQKENLKLIAGLFSLASFTICGIAFFGYLLDIETMYGWSGFIGMAFLTAACHILIAAAILLELENELRSKHTEPVIWPIIYTYGVGITISIILLTGTLSFKSEEFYQEFYKYTHSRTVELRHAIENDINLLQAVNSLFKSSASVTREEFKNFVTPILKQNPSILAIDWAPKVTEERRAGLEQEMKKFSSTGFRQFSRQRKLAAREKSPFYFPVVYSESARFQKPIIGFDHYSDELRKSAMDSALSSGKPSSTTPFTLFRIPKEGTLDEDFLVFIPGSNYEKNSDSIPEDSQGFIVGVFRFSRLLKAVEDTSIDKEFNVVPYYGDMIPVGNSQAYSEYRGESIIDVLRIADKEWKLYYTPTSDFIASHSSYLPFIVFACSLIFTFILSRYLLMLKAQRSSLRKGNKYLRSVQNDLEEAKNFAESENKIKSQFLANMSHEIRTPLTGIIGYSESLIADSLTAMEKNQALSAILKNGKHLLNVLNDILDLTKIQAGKLTIEPTDTCLPAILDDVKNLMIHRASEKGLLLTHDYEFPLPKQIHTDPLRFKQILINLIGNSIKFTDSGEVSVRVSYAEKSEFLKIAICDTGIGMTTEQIKKLFMAFSQADESISRKFGGTGLGLVISADLASRLGGGITVQSEVDYGSIFTLTIACGPVAKGEIAADLSSWKPGAENQADMAIHHQLKGRVLLAEDGSDNQQYISFILNKAGLNVTVCDNGLMAVEAVKSAKFDLILMDMQMPVMNGYTAVKLLRDQGYKQPIIALTANVLQSDVKKCLEAGCDDFVGKPFERKILFNKIQNLLQPAVGEIAADSYHAEEITTEELVSEEPELLPVIIHFLDKLPGKVIEIQKAYKANDLDQCVTMAHRLKGTSFSFGFNNLAGFAGRIEKTIEEHEDSSQLARLINQLDNAAAEAVRSKDTIAGHDNHTNI